jgi:hypothetical protein
LLGRAFLAPRLLLFEAPPLLDFEAARLPDDFPRDCAREDFLPRELLRLGPDFDRRDFAPLVFDFAPAADFRRDFARPDVFVAPDDFERRDDFAPPDFEATGFPRPAFEEPARDDTALLRLPPLVEPVRPPTPVAARAFDATLFTVSLGDAPVAAARPASPPITPPTTAPTGPATLPRIAPVAAPTVCFGIGGI